MHEKLLCSYGRLNSINKNLKVIMKVYQFQRSNKNTIKMGVTTYPNDY